MEKWLKATVMLVMYIWMVIVIDVIQTNSIVLLHFKYTVYRLNQYLGK